MNKAEAIANRIKSNDNFENVAYVCCDWEEFVFEVAEWGVDHIATVDFDSLSDEDISFLDEFIASFGCSPSQPHPCSKPRVCDFPSEWWEQVASFSSMTVEMFQMLRQSWLTLMRGFRGL